MKKLLIAMTALLAVALVPVSVNALTDSTTERLGENAKQRITAARERVQKAKAAAQERRLVIAQKKCDAMKDRITTVVPKLSKSVTSIKTTLDKHYDRIKAVHDKGTLDTPDYDTLLAAADETKVAAEASIALVDPTSVTVDCAAGGLGVQLDSYRATIKETRTYLKEYRTALVNLISAMNASSNKTTTEGATDENN